MTKNRYIFCLLLLTVFTTKGQIRGFFKSNQTLVVSEFLNSQFFAIRSDYVLKTKDAVFGRDNQNFFSFREGKVLLLESGYFVGNQRLLTPWENDSLFDRYRSKPDTIPALGTLYIKYPGQESYSIVSCDTMFTEGGLSYFKLTDTIALDGIHSETTDSIVDSDWIYAHRVYKSEDSLKVDSKTLNVGSFKSSKAIVSALKLSSQINENTIARDAFFFQTEYSKSGIQFTLMGYMDESDMFHSVKTVIEATKEDLIEEKVDSSMFTSVSLVHVDGFLLSHKKVNVNGKDVYSDSMGRIYIENKDDLSINGYQVKLIDDLPQIVLFYEKNNFTPIKRQRVK